MKRSDASIIANEAIAEAKRRIGEAEAACATWEKAHADMDFTIGKFMQEVTTLKSQVEQRDVVLEDCEKVLAIDLKELFISTPGKLKWIESRNGALASIHKLKGGVP